MTMQFIGQAGTWTEFELVPTSADSTKELIVPANHLYIIQYMFLSMVADGNAASRVTDIDIQNLGGDITMRCVNTTVTLGVTATHQWGMGEDNRTGNIACHNWVKPAILAGGRLEIRVPAILAGDAWSLRGLLLDQIIRWPTTF